MRWPDPGLNAPPRRAGNRYGVVEPWRDLVERVQRARGQRHLAAGAPRLGKLDNLAARRLVGVLIALS
jgi:hypothetical protein